MHKQIFFFSLLTLTACGQNPTQSSETKALVSQQQANQAFDIVSGIDYLSFSFIVDGCYARSLYMSLELAAQGIPSSEHYVYGSLQPTTDVGWGYHVAPLLQVKDTTQEPWILDPAFEAGPLTRSEWIQKDFAAAQDVGIPVKEVAKATTFIRAGSAYFDFNGRASKYETPETNLFSVTTNASGQITGLTPKPINKAKLIADFSSMPTFLSGDIHSACTVIYEYIGNEELGSAAIRSKRSRLLSATNRLVSTMDRMGKLSRNGLSGSDDNPYYDGDADTKCTAALAGYYR